MQDIVPTRNPAPSTKHLRTTAWKAENNVSPLGKTWGITDYSREWKRKCRSFSISTYDKNAVSNVSCFLETFGRRLISKIKERIQLFKRQFKLRLWWSIYTWHVAQLKLKYYIRSIKIVIAKQRTTQIAIQCVMCIFVFLFFISQNTTCYGRCKAFSLH